MGNPSSPHYHENRLPGPFRAASNLPLRLHPFHVSVFTEHLLCARHLEVGASRKITLFASGKEKKKNPTSLSQYMRPNVNTVSPRHLGETWASGPLGWSQSPRGQEVHRLHLVLTSCFPAGPRGSSRQLCASFVTVTTPSGPAPSGTLPAPWMSPFVKRSDSPP